ADPYFICEGALCIRRAFEHGWRVRCLLTTEPQRQALAPLIAQDTEVLVGDNALLQSVTGVKVHRGCLAAVGKRPVGAPDFSQLGVRSTVLFAEAVSTPSNMGALMRTCRPFGVDWLVLTGASADPFSRRSVRTAMGNVFSLKLGLVTDLAAAITDYR